MTVQHNTTKEVHAPAVDGYQYQSSMKRGAYVPKVASGLLTIVLLAACALPCAVGLDQGGDLRKKRIEKLNSSRLRILVPAYFRPADKGLADWNKLLKASRRVPIVAVVTPSVGPGKERDPDYVRLFEQAEKTDIILIGYIHSSYTKRTINELKEEVDRWIRLYPGVQGIFVDEQSSQTNHVAYYAELRRHIRDVRGLDLMVSNAGVVCPKDYFGGHASDVICIRENHDDSVQLPDWPVVDPPVDVMALAHGVKLPEQMKKWVAVAAEKKFRYIYVTDDIMDNPYDRLPTYWDQEVNAVQTVNEAVVK